MALPCLLASFWNADDGAALRRTLVALVFRGVLNRQVGRVRVIGLFSGKTEV